MDLIYQQGGVHHDCYTVLAHQEVGSLRREVLWNARKCSLWYKDLSKLPCRLVLQILLAFLKYIPSPLQEKLCLSLPQILQPLVFGPALNLRFVHASDYHSGLLTGLSISSSLFSNFTSATNPFNKNLTAISSISSRLPQPPSSERNPSLSMCKSWSIQTSASRAPPAFLLTTLLFVWRAEHKPLQTSAAFCLCMCGRTAPLTSLYFPPRPSHIPLSW